jgi:hypothetical protein
MIWFTIYNILKQFTSMENKTINLTTFLAGTFLYILFYSYIDSVDFLKRIFALFVYIVIADIFAMAILYKNCYNKPIFTKVNETLSHKRTESDVNIEDVSTSDDNISILLLNNSSDYVDENEGFTKDSALGNSYNTNGNSNA